MSSSSNRSFLAVAILLLLLLSIELRASKSGKQKVDQAINTTVCQLVHEPKRYSGKMVRVSAVVESDLIEHTALADDACNSYEISLWIPHELDDDRQVKTLRKVLKEQWKPGAADMRVLGIFTGIFSVEGKKRFLRVSKLEDIRVSGS